MRRRRDWGQRQGPLVLEENVLRLGRTRSTPVPSERRAKRPVTDSYVYSHGLVSDLEYKICSDR